MDTDARLLRLRDSMQRDLRGNVLPFWLGHVLDEKAGFRGLVAEAGRADEAAPMGGVLCARLLWTFSAAYRRTGDPGHRRAADHFRSWLTGRFLDERYGGIQQQYVFAWYREGAGRRERDA